MNKEFKLISFFIGCIVGGLIGFAAAALASASKDDK